MWRSFDDSGMLAEVIERMQVARERTMYSASASSTTEPPDAWLAFCSASSPSPG